MKSAPEFAFQDSLIADLPDNEHDLERLQGDRAILDLPEVKDIPGQEHIRVMPLGEMADTTASSADEEGAGLLDFDEQDDEIDEDDDDSVVIDTDEEDEISGEDLDVEEITETTDDDAEVDYEDEDFFTEDDTDEFEDADLDDEELDDDELSDDDDLPVAAMQSSAREDSNTIEGFDGIAVADREAMDATISDEEISLLENSGPVEKDSDTDNLNRSKLDNTDQDGDVLNEVTLTNNVDGNHLDVPGSELDDANEALGEEDEENNMYSMSDSE